MVTIGTGRDDPRQWVKVAYTVNDAIQCGQTGPYGKLTTRSELARTLSVHPQTVARAYKELADLGIIYLIPGTWLLLHRPGITASPDLGA